MEPMILVEPMKDNMNEPAPIADLFDQLAQEYEELLVEVKMFEKKAMWRCLLCDFPADAAPTA